MADLLFASRLLDGPIKKAWLNQNAIFEYNQVGKPKSGFSTLIELLSSLKKKQVLYYTKGEPRIGRQYAFAKSLWPETEQSADISF